LATNFVALDSDKLAFPAFIICAGIYNGWEDRKTYTHAKTPDEPSAVNHWDIVASLQVVGGCI